MKNLKKVELSQLSDIQVDYYFGVSEEIEILVIKYSGKYGFGSAGNTDAIYMNVMGKAAMEAWDPDAIIIDLQDINYEWGDMLEYVFNISADKYPNEALPLAVIVGTGCEKAVRTLLLGIDSKEPIDKIGWIFKDLETACKYINKKFEGNL
ncbi:hypothetical protein [Lysinibacillus sp. NPDC056185]|uniref:hypothetical protein n=1 Tax=Lysinibacillus sp. NPDC056185 TaxID=3345739 RepID=UPI0039EE87C8